MFLYIETGHLSSEIAGSRGGYYEDDRPDDGGIKYL
jgi:hypothetical protein